MGTKVIKLGSHGILGSCILYMCNELNVMVYFKPG